MELRHATVTVDGRCIDLLLTDEEIAVALERYFLEENQKYIDMEKCCSCWPLNKPPECPFWKKIMGICTECDKH